MPDSWSDQIVWKTDVSTFDTGPEQRRARWANERRIISFRYNNLINIVGGAQQIQDLYDFYQDRKGAFDCFYLTIPERLEHTETLAAGTDIVLTEATRPCSVNMTVFLGNTQTTAFTYDSATKTITLDAAYTGAVTVVFYESELVRFQDDNMSLEWMVRMVIAGTINFITV
jgi:hypothetical protein